MSSAKRRKFDTSLGMLPGYFESMKDEMCRKRCREKLEYSGGVDLYELPLEEWDDDVEL